MSKYSTLKKKKLPSWGLVFLVFAHLRPKLAWNCKYMQTGLENISKESHNFKSFQKALNMHVPWNAQWNFFILMTFQKSS